MLQLLVLGTHGAFRQAPGEYHTNALVMDGSSTYLIDAGATVIEALAAANVQPPAVDGVFVTHVHGDHVGGIEELAFRKYYLEWQKLHVVAPDDVWEELFCYLDTTLTPFNAWDGSISHRLNDIIDISRIPLTITGRTLPFSPDMDSTMEFVGEPVVHVPGKPCCAYTVRDRSTGAGFWWSGDTVFCPDAIEAAACFVGTLFVDCHAKPAWPGTVHTHIDQLQMLTQETQEKIRLIHYGSDVSALPFPSDVLRPAVAGELFKF